MIPQTALLIAVSALAIGGVVGWLIARRTRPPLTLTVTTASTASKPSLPATGNNWVGLTAADGVDDETAAATFARFQQQISDGQHVDVVAGTSVEWVKGSTVHKSFRVV